MIDKKLNLPISLAIVSIGHDRTTSLNTNELGEVVFDGKDFSHLEIGFLGGPYAWNFSEKIRGDILVYLVEEDLTKAYFENEMWQMSGRKMISPDGLVYKFKREQGVASTTPSIQYHASRQNATSSQHRKTCAGCYTPTSKIISSFRGTFSSCKPVL